MKFPARTKASPTVKVLKAEKQIRTSVIIDSWDVAGQELNYLGLSLGP